MRNLYLWLECKLSGRSWRAENARLGVRREAAHDLARLWVLQLDAHGKRVGRLGDAEVVELGAHVRAEGRRVLLDKDALACTELERLRHDNDALKATQEAEYEDHYFDEDAIYMERNSRDFQEIGRASCRERVS